MQIAVPLIHPVILSGGVGTRLWPLSRSTHPKQFLPLVSDRSMIQETIERVRGAGFAAPLMVCSNEHRFLVAQQMHEMGLKAHDIVLEPMGRNTAPAAAVAALLLAAEDADALMLLLPSDHAIADIASFHAALTRAAVAAREGALVTFGITPDAPATGYGYIEQGAAFNGHAGCHKVARFVEKPDPATAQGYLDHGGFLWNSGMFLFPVRAYLAELERLEPEMLAACREALAKAGRDLDFLRLDPVAFARAKSQSIDYAVMEHTGRAVVVPVSMGWNDVGSWSALWGIGSKDTAGNVSHGDVLTEDSSDSYFYSNGHLVAAVGVKDIILVATPDAVLAVHKDRAEDVKKIVDRLKLANRSEHIQHAKVYRPWGSYQTIDAGDRFQVKQIVVNPGAKLSLQYHYHRAEHWIVVEGTARVTRGNETLLLHENESTFIPLGQMHRLENPGKVPLRLIEVQSGAYLGEDDIVRVEDQYGRIEV
ncbi:MAG: mannose-1-phosphate guanylyltransferase/mannose-6-phosphate isomerase [Rhodospirillales bacterium]|nr:mannose-1-phosphate guanylyltransferase/mannose-6-phosphate isomerase [Rhodospirillales bacterium]